MNGDAHWLQACSRDSRFLSQPNVQAQRNHRGTTSQCSSLSSHVVQHPHIAEMCATFDSTLPTLFLAFPSLWRTRLQALPTSRYQCNRMTLKSSTRRKLATTLWQPIMPTPQRAQTGTSHPLGAPPSLWNSFTPIHCVRCHSLKH